ncbi:MAG: carbamoyltransferase family protein [Methylocystis sp.]
MIIIGLNAFHGDASAALLRDGQLVAAAEEERFRRIKHWAGFPSEAIRYCLSQAQVSLSDVDRIALNQNGGANLSAKLAYLLRVRPGPGLLLDKIRNRGAREQARELLKQAFPGAKLRATLDHVEHHLAHLSSAFHVSPFEAAVVASVDGFGDFASGAWGVGHGERIDIEGRCLFPHSLGIFYQAITQYLGFPHYGDEYKIMGLAPYGAPRYLPQMRRMVLLKSDGSYELDLRYFRHQTDRIAFKWQGGAPQFADLFTPALEALLGPRRRSTEQFEDRHRDIACSAQAMYEEAFFNLLNALHARHKIANVALAGGCAMNCVANGKIGRMTPFRKVYVQAAAGDAGGAIGAAFAVWHRNGGKRSFVMDHAYWGPQFGADDIERLLAEQSARLASAGCVVAKIGDEQELCKRTAQAVADGKIIGWFQGRMEWGPRALGNRSIVGDPRRGDMKDILNAKIKRRESFRPFAPSVLQEAVADWFEDEGDVPFMMQAFRIREDKRPIIPAVAHVDGSGRLQTVRQATNPRYYGLISAFFDLTGVPMVLNTSFNENEPVVCEPKEAMDCFLRTDMDVLVLGDAMIARGGSNGGV